MKRAILTVGFLCLASLLVLGHPHIQKTVTAKIGDHEIKLSYYTTPANMEHATAAAVGSFSSGGAVLALPVSMQAGDVQIPAGEYMVGAVKDSEDSWTMGLHAGRLSFGQEPDMSNVIRLKSMLSEGHGVAEHSHFDISPGSGSLEGKTTVSWHFGNLYLAGALD